MTLDVFYERLAIVQGSRSIKIANWRPRWRMLIEGDTLIQGGRDNYEKIGWLIFVNNSREIFKKLFIGVDTVDRDVCVRVYRKYPKSLLMDQS